MPRRLGQDDLQRGADVSLEKMTAVRWASLVVALAGVLILSDFDWRHLGLASGKYAFGPSSR